MIEAKQPNEEITAQLAETIQTLDEFWNEIFFKNRIINAASVTYNKYALK